MITSSRQTCYGAKCKDHPDHGSLRPPKRIALIFDEWGVVVGDENSAFYFNQQNSLRDALAAASTLNSR